MKIDRLGFILGVLSLIVFQSNVGAADWRVDSAHTRVGFSVSHLGINTVHGAFKKYSAEIVADDNGKLSSVTAEVSVASVDTGIDGRDDHLRAEDVFNVAKYPKMTLETDSIVWNGNHFTGKAALTIKSTTRTVKFKGKKKGVKTVTAEGKSEKRVGYAVEAVVNRKHFDIAFGGFSEGLGMVGETVKIILDVEVVRPV
jgi:polyisoprenoid-binding protein YceI